jgi:hypothetical protein
VAGTFVVIEYVTDGSAANIDQVVQHPAGHPDMLRAIPLWRLGSHERQHTVHDLLVIGARSKSIATVTWSMACSAISAI